MNRTLLYSFFIFLASIATQPAFSQHHYGLGLGAIRGIYAIQNQLHLSYNLSLTYRVETRIPHVRLGLDINRVQIHTGNNWESLVSGNAPGDPSPAEYRTVLSQGSTGVLGVFQYVGRTWRKFRLVGELATGMSIHDNPTIKTDIRFDPSAQQQAEVVIDHAINTESRLAHLVRFSLGPDYQIGEYAQLGFRLYSLGSNRVFIYEDNFTPITTTIHYNSKSVHIENYRQAFGALGFNLCFSYRY